MPPACRPGIGSPLPPPDTGAGLFPSATCASRTPAALTGDTCQPGVGRKALPFQGRWHPTARAYETRGTLRQNGHPGSEGRWMTLQPGLMLACMLGIGFLAQWLAWRVKLPAILFLLLAGIVLGPATGVFRPDAMLGDLLFPLVSLAVALILFEGSMTLRFHELPDIGRAVRGLVSYGAIAALLLLALAARLIAGL